MMHVIIFTTALDNIRKIRQEIVDKLYLLGACTIEYSNTKITFPQKDVTIEILTASPLKVRGLRPRYFLVDDTCSYDFYEMARESFVRKGDECASSMHHLTMKIIETVLYGDKKEDTNNG